MMEGAPKEMGQETDKVEVRAEGGIPALEEGQADKGATVNRGHYGFFV